VNCKRCQSNRIADVTGKCSDCCNITLKGTEHDGSIPKDIGIGAGDYIEFSYCLDCGQIQGTFPTPVSEELEAEKEEE
jgi:hypothetical protein